MRVLMLTNTYKPFVGGVPESVDAYTRTFRKRGHDVKVVAPTFSGQNGKQSDVIRVPALHEVGESPFSVSLPSPGYVRNRLGSFEPDVVHTHHPFLLGMKGLRLASEFDVPVVFTHHTRYEEYTHNLPVDGPPVQRYARAQASGYADQCDAVIAPSESIRQDLQSRDVESPIRVIPTGVDRDRFQDGNGGRIRQQYGIPEETHVAGYVGRCSREKNLGLLLDGLSEFVESDEDTHGLIVGDGPMKSTLEDTIEQRGLEDQIHCTGSLTGQRLVDAYHAMDQFVFASRSETQGMVLTEAMAAGSPVVALDASGVRDVVSDRDNGRLLNTIHSDALLEGMTWYRNRSKDEKQHIRNRARQTAREWSLERSATRMIELYRSVIRSYRMNQSPFNPVAPLRRMGAELRATMSRVHGIEEVLTPTG